jgi:hypothetical protein
VQRGLKGWQNNATFRPPIQLAPVAVDVSCPRQAQLAAVTHADEL